MDCLIFKTCMVLCLFGLEVASGSTQGCESKILQVFDRVCEFPGSKQQNALQVQVAPVHTFCSITCLRTKQTSYMVCSPDGQWEGPGLQCEGKTTEGLDIVGLEILSNIIRRNLHESADDSPAPRHRKKRGIETWLRKITSTPKPARYKTVTHCFRRIGVSWGWRTRFFRRGVCCPSRVKDPPDYDPPSIQCPTITSPVTAPLTKSTAVVRWGNPTVRDKQCSGGNEYRQALPDGRGSGSHYKAGRHPVSYVARDCNYNVKRCVTYFDVNVIACPRLQLTNGYVACQSAERAWGTSCTLTCNRGHKLTGPARHVCQNNKQWSPGGSVSCQKLSCGAPLMPNNTKVTCTDNYFYDSVCLATCSGGLRMPQTEANQIKCGDNELWTGRFSDCQDVEPPQFQNCPSSIRVYADKGKSDASVSWSTPVAVDNIDGQVTASLVSGNTPGSRFGQGSHSVRYTAVDSSGNKAPNCEFTIQVTQITCPIIQPSSSSMSVSCAPGLGYGFTCEVRCQGDSVLIGSAEGVCEKTTSEPLTGYWMWGQNRNQTYCLDIQDTTPPNVTCPTPSSPIFAKKKKVPTATLR